MAEKERIVNYPDTLDWAERAYEKALADAEHMAEEIAEKLAECAANREY